MKQLRTLNALLAGLVLTGVVSAQPACLTGETEINNTSSLLSGNFLCAARAPDTWQEFHQTGGALYDWKRGPNDAVDRTALVGTWSTATGTVTHTYGAQSYSWRVCRTSAGSIPTYALRSSTGGTITSATVVSGAFAQTNKPCPY